MDKHFHHCALRSRRGSVLLFVVALLMLLGLMGISYLFNVRMDRTHLSSTVGGVGGAWPTINLDFTDNSVKNLIASALLSDLFTPNTTTPSSSTYRTFSPAGYPSSYVDYDDPQTKTWLASPHPVSTTGAAKWEWVSGPLTVNGTASYSPPNSSGSTGRQGLTPSFVKIYYDPATVTAPKAIIGKYRLFPSFDGSTIDADADGDGIPDSKLQLLDPSAQPISVGSRSVKIYVGFRFVDNCASINVNTAYSRSGFGGAGYLQALLGTFRSDIGLQELLQDATNSTTEFSNLNNYRYSGMNVTTPSIGSGFNYITGADAAENEMARRIYNPGGSCQAMDQSGSDSQAAMKFRAGMMRPGASQTPLETAFNYDAWYNSPDYHQSASTILPYFPCVNPGGSDFWYNLTYNFDSTSRANFFASCTPSVPATPPQAIRDFLVTKNPVANTAPGHSMSLLPAGIKGASVNLMPDSATDGSTYIRKACVNTASFGELWRAYWNIFADDAIPNNPILPTDTIQCRHALRHYPSGTNLPSNAGLAGTGPWSNKEQMLVRSALAAINTLQERSLDPNTNGTNYVLSRQISFPLYSPPTAWSDTVNVFAATRQPYITRVFVQRSSNNLNYFAVELYNPYSSPIVMAQNWRLAVLKRGSIPSSLIYTILNSSLITAGTTVPAGGYVILTLGPKPNNVSYSAGVSAVTLPTNFMGSITATDCEVYLLRPRRADGVLSNFTYSGTPSANGENYTFNEGTFTDLVPIDMVDVALPSYDSLTPRPVNQWMYSRPAGASYPFQCVYYGPCAANQNARPSGSFVGTPNSQWMVKNFESANPATVSDAPQTLGAGHGAGGVNWTSFFTIQLGNFTPVNQIAGSNNAFPFGGFARDGDILRVPFIGSYTIKAGANVIEMIPVTMDAMAAEADYTAGAPTSVQAQAQVGRFCPAPDTGGTLTSYDFAKRLFSYLTAIQNPDDAKSPNVYYDASTPTLAPSYYTKASNPAPATVPNNGYNGVHGKININTASWKVLSMLPLVVNGGNVDVTATENLAKAIVNDRITNGPFKSIFDLNRVPAFRNAATEGSYANGDLYPNSTGSGFKQTYLELARLSNLLTVRSDSFTVYVVVQAWQDSGTTTPVLLNEKRTAFLIDRSTVNKNTTVQDFLANNMTPILTQ